MNHSFWNFISKVYDRTIGRFLAQDIPLLIALGEFTSTDIVLDYGGGTGRVAKAIRPMVREVVVADTASHMLREAEAKGLRTVLLDSLPTSFSDDAFGAILVIEALHHLPDHEAHLKEFWRILKPGGTLIIEEHDTTSWIRFWLWTERFTGRVKFHSPKEWHAMIARNGFVIEKEVRKGFRYFVRARKV